MSGKIGHLRRASLALAEIFDATGLSREGLARELGVKRDAVQRMIRAAAVPLERLPQLERLCKGRVDLEYELSDDGLRAVGLKINRHLAILRTHSESGRNRTMAISASLKVPNPDLTHFTDLQLKHELEARGWVVQEPKVDKNASK
jgi:hypothetical protein